MIKRPSAKIARLKRARRVRARMHGTAERPRLSIFRSSEHIYAQLIDDDAGTTIASASTVESELKPMLAGLQKSKRAEKIGDVMGRRAAAAGVSAVVFDRGGFRYHGRVQALANAARAAGLQF